MKAFKPFTAFIKSFKVSQKSVKIKFKFIVILIKLPEMRGAGKVDTKINYSVLSCNLYYLL